MDLPNYIIHIKPNNTEKPKHDKCVFFLFLFFYSMIKIMELRSQVNKHEP